MYGNNEGKSWIISFRQNLSGNLDNMLSGNYCCGLEHFSIYLCGVFDFFSLCFTMEGAQGMFNG